jgi:hypothetical protein
MYNDQTVSALSFCGNMAVGHFAVHGDATRRFVSPKNREEDQSECANQESSRSLLWINIAPGTRPALLSPSVAEIDGFCCRRHLLCPRDTDYASVIESDVPAVVQPPRLDSRQAENALLSTVAYTSDDCRR